MPLLPWWCREIAGRVEDHARLGVSSVGAAGEPVQHSSMAGGVHSKHHAFLVWTAELGSPVKVVRRIADQSCHGARAVRRGCTERSEDLSKLLPGRDGNGG